MTPAPPRLLFTLGDVAGIGPEITARAWPDLLPLCRPVVVGDPLWLERALALVGSSVHLEVVAHPAQANPRPGVVSCIAGSDMMRSQYAADAASSETS